jgi:Major Facilitator Superfamily
MLARAGSPVSAATSANCALLAMIPISLDGPASVAGEREECFGKRRNDQPPCRATLASRAPGVPVRKPLAGASMATDARTGPYYGWRVVAAAFVLAFFGWGVGFYGPPVYLHALREARGWSLALVSSAVTLHFLMGAIAVANLPRLYRRFGVAAVTKAGALALAAGIMLWALAQAPWQLFAATCLSGGGWAATGAAAVNAIIAPWFVRTRPAALASAYNGASIGGVIFSPLWVAAIGAVGLAGAATAVGLVMVTTVWILADAYFAKTPARMGLSADGDPPGVAVSPVATTSAGALPRRTLRHDGQFITLAAGMALGLFAQAGILAHLFSLLVPALGAPLAGLAAGAATAAAIAGRTLVGWLMPARADRRLVACASYAAQIAGSIAFLLAGGSDVPLLLLGVLLFGAGVGNATSLPPLIAQAEFTSAEVARVVPLIVAASQATYAFAPAAFGLVREFAGPMGAASTEAAPYLFVATGVIQGLAIVAMLAGRRR